MVTRVAAAVFIWARSRVPCYSLAFELGWCKRLKCYTKHSATRFMRKGCQSWESHPESQGTGNKVHGLKKWVVPNPPRLWVTGFLQADHTVSVGRQLGIYFVHPGRLSNAHPAPCTTLLSQRSPAPMVKSICLSCQADASPPYDPGFLWSRRRKLVWMSVSEAKELKCWLSLTYHAENTHCLSLKPSKIPGLSRWSATPVLWGHSLGLTLTSCMTSVAKCLHRFLKQFWGAFENTKLDSSCRAKFKAP